MRKKARLEQAEQERVKEILTSCNNLLPIAGPSSTHLAGPSSITSVDSFLLAVQTLIVLSEPLLTVKSPVTSSESYLDNPSKDKVFKF
jgi:hypothetical protein